MNTSRRVSFILEGNAATGGGHLARCAVLAEILTGFGWQATLRMEEDPTSMLPRLVGAFSCWKKGNDPDGPCELAIFDGYHLDETIERRWASFARRRMVIDDLADRRHDANSLFDSTPGRSAADYLALMPAGSRIFAGPEYALLRPSWRSYSSRRGHSVPEKIGKVVVSMGASDPRNATAQALKAALISLPDAKISAIVGKAAPHLSDIRNCFSDVVEILVDPDDHDERIAGADLVIGAAGSSALERACAGVPSIACVTASNQINLAGSLAEHGVTRVLKETEWQDVEVLTETIRSLERDSGYRLQFSRIGPSIVDGRGALRSAIAATAFDEAGYSLRLFETSDSDWLLALQCMPQTRKFSRNPEAPTNVQHSAYVNSILSCGSRVLLIIQRENLSLGYVRLDFMSGEKAELSIAVDPNFHGRGIGSAALRLARMVAPGMFFQAFVKDANLPSAALFANAGYILSKRHADGFWLVSAPNDLH